MVSKVTYKSKEEDKAQDLPPPKLKGREMATTLNSSNLLHTSIPCTRTNSLPFSTSHSPPPLRFRRRPGSSTLTRAGPSTNQFIFAFVFPLSLLGITAFTAFRVGEKLDEKFLEELAMNEAIREAEEEDADVSGVPAPRKEEPALPPSRNRPRREV